MKSIWKLIVLSSIIVFFTNNNFAQVTAGGQIGLNISSLNGYKNYDESSLRIGAAAYLLVDIPVISSGFMSLETGVGISQMGMKYKTHSEGIGTLKDVEIKNSLDYVVMPLYLKENFSGMYTKFGLYGAYLLNAQSKITTTETKFGEIQEPIKSVDEEFAKNANPYDYGVSFGFGFIKQFKSKRFRRRGGRRVLPTLKIDFKYNIGIAQISTEKKPDIKLRNRVFMVGITFSSVAR